MGDFFVSAAGLKTLLEEPDPPRILDVRKRQAFEASGEILPGAEWRDPHDVATWAKTLRADRAYVVYCVHGHEVSQGTGTALQDLGLKVRVLAGGFEAWRQSGGETEPARRER